MKTKKQVSGKTTTKKKVVKPKPKPKEFTPEALEQALFEAEDDFNRAVLRVMLLGETLRSIKEDNMVKGNKLELGMLKSRMTKEVRGWFNEFGYKISTTKMTKSYNGVPVEVKIIKRSYPFFDHLDTVFYKSLETMDIPNPWKACYKIRGLIR